MMRTVKITTEFITLGQFLKLVDAIGIGGEAKFYLSRNMPQINGEDDNRRGRKLYPGDSVALPDGRTFKLSA